MLHSQWSSTENIIYKQFKFYVKLFIPKKKLLKKHKIGLSPENNSKI